MDSKGYRRPDRQWKCGIPPSAAPCLHGPDAVGRCESGQCHPRRNLRWWRAYLPWAMATVCMGSLATFYLANRQQTILAPGPLSSAHAQLIQNADDPHRCASCHAGSGSLSTERLAELDLRPALLERHSQTVRCLLCHARDLPRMKLLTPHDLPLDQLQQLTSRTASQSSPPSQRLVSWTAQPPLNWTEHDLSCSDCHREHQGAEHDLQAITNRRCQACHQRSFHSFAQDHPEFRDYPPTRQRQLAFDHQRHEALHFPKTMDSFDCRQCHLSETRPGHVGQVIRSLPFEQTCARCHTNSLHSSLLDGVVVFQFPSLNVTELTKLGMDIGPWPEAASQLTEGKLPPIMRWLLEGRPEVGLALKKLPASGRWQELDLGDEEQRRVLAIVIDGCRKLLDDLARGGQTAWEEHWIGSTGLQAQQLHPLLAGFPPDLFRTAYRDWLESIEPQPERASRLTATAAPDIGLPGTATGSSDLPLLTSGGNGNLATDDRLLGSDSSADPLLVNLPEALSPAGNLDRDQQRQPWKDLKARQHLTGGGWMIDRQRLAILYVPQAHADPWLTALLNLGYRKLQQDQTESSSPADARRATHLDDFAQEFLSTNGLGRCTECHQAMADPRNQTTAKRSYHAWESSLGQTQTGTATGPQRWRAQHLDARIREMTRFDHGPHLIQTGLSDCRSCHRPTASAGEAPPLAGVARGPIEGSDFLALHRSDCIACHRPQAAGDNCTQCHNYHTHGVDYKYMPTNP